MAKSIKLKELEVNHGAEKLEVGGFEAVVPQIRQIDDQVATLQEERQVLRKLIMDKVSQLMEAGLSSGKIVKSYLISSADKQPATVLYKNAYKKLDQSNEPIVREFLGDLFARFFRVECDVNIALKSSADLNQLREALGERFSEFFDEEKIQHVAFAKDFMEQRAALHDQMTAKVRNQLDKWMREYQASPDLRMKG